MLYNFKYISVSITALSFVALTACGGSDAAVPTVETVQTIQTSAQTQSPEIEQNVKPAKDAVYETIAAPLKQATAKVEAFDVTPVTAKATKAAAPDAETVAQAPSAAKPVELKASKPAPVKSVTAVQNPDVQNPAVDNPAVDNPAVVAPVAAPIAAPSAPVSQAAKVWAVDSDASHLKFSALQEGERFDGEFKTFTANIKFSPDNLEDSSLSVTVPISGADAGSADRNSTLPGKVWFSVKKFPDAVYTANDFVKIQDGQYEAQGALTMKGVSKPLTLPFSLQINGNTALMTSKLNMNRNNWNIGETPWNTDEWVSTEVTLDIQITATSE